VKRLEQDGRDTEKSRKPTCSMHAASGTLAMSRSGPGGDTRAFAPHRKVKRLIRQWIRSGAVKVERGSTVIADKTEGITFVGFVGSVTKRCPRARRRLDGEIIRTSTRQTGEPGAWEGFFVWCKQTQVDSGFAICPRPSRLGGHRFGQVLQRHACEPGPHRRSRRQVRRRRSGP
jgi:hypothetical protein